jgi:multidrug efflux pump subunit AcrB
MKQPVWVLFILFVLFSCNLSVKTDVPSSSSTSSSRPQIEGTWKLVSATTIVRTDTTVEDYTKNMEMIKIINETHFAFLKHDFTKGRDSVVYSSGGGSYTLVDSLYTESLDYCSAKEWEGHKFPFSVTVIQDTLLQTGVEKVENIGVDRYIIEKYIRARK